MTNRLFVSLEIPAEMKELLVKGSSGIYNDTDCKWESEEKLHITLKFLGDTGAELTENIWQDIIELSKKYNGFEIHFRGFKLIRRGGTPSMIWAEMYEKSGSLSEYVFGINKAMKKYGIESENRPFIPHVTLLRIRGREDIDKLINITNLKYDEYCSRASNIALVQSKLMPEGSVYRRIKSLILE